MKINNLIISILLLISCSNLLSANELKVLFEEYACVGNNYLALGISLESESITGSDVVNMGTSSLFFNYNSNILSFDSYQTVGFSTSPWENCIDVSKTTFENGFLNITLHDTNNSGTEFASGSAFEVGILFFKVIDPAILHSEAGIGAVAYNKKLSQLNKIESADCPNDGTCQVSINSNNAIYISSTIDVTNVPGIDETTPLIRNHNYSCPSNCRDLLSMDFTLNKVFRNCGYNNGAISINWLNNKLNSSFTATLYRNSIPVYSLLLDQYIPNERYTFANLSTGSYTILITDGNCEIQLPAVEIDNIAHYASFSYDGCDEITFFWDSQDGLNLKLSTDGGSSFTENLGSYSPSTINMRNGTYDLVVRWSGNTLCRENLGQVLVDAPFSGVMGMSAPNTYGFVNLTMAISGPSNQNLTYKWENGRTTPNITEHCIYEENYVEVTEPNSGCTIRYLYEPQTSGICSYTPAIDDDIPPRFGNFQKDKVTIQPNPTNGLFVVNFEASDIEYATLNIYSLAGQIVKEQQVSPNESVAIIDASRLSNGMYLIKIITNEGEQIFSDKITIAD